MRVKAIQHVEVELSQSEILRIIQQHLIITDRWKRGHFIGSDNKVYHEVDIYTSHHSSSYEYVRDATPEDVAYYSLYQGD
jgi:hypothetical protein